MPEAGSGDLRTIANGLIPSGFDAAALTPEGRDEVRAAIDVILRLWDYRSARLTLALEELDKAADCCELMRSALREIRDCHLGDCPASQDEATHARAHIFTLREMAMHALKD